jgi:hypothetical protein
MLLIKKWFKLNLCLITGLIAVKSAQAQSYVPEWNDSRIKIKPQTTIKAYSFDLKDVQLLESPFKKAMQVDAAYLLSIEPDRLLSGFRSHSGLKPKAKIYGGWESSGLAGHTGALLISNFPALCINPRS